MMSNNLKNKKNRSFFKTFDDEFDDEEVGTERKPLFKIKVLDFGQYIAGPLTSTLLADFGADVIHIDPPTGPFMNTPANVRLNRSKEVLRLDLKSSSGIEQAKALIKDADVLVENFSPGTMEKLLGLSLEDIMRMNPRLVYASLPAFASEDEEHADLKGYEGIILAASGVFTDMGLNRQLMGDTTSYSPLYQASTYAASLCATSIVSALYKRESTGLGDHIEVPLASALLDALVYNAVEVEDKPPRYKSMRQMEIARRRKQNIPFDLKYEDIDRFLDPFYATYMCKDERPFYLVAPSHWKHQQRTLKLLGLWEEVVKQGLPIDKALVHQDWDGTSVKCALGTYPLSDPKWISRLKIKMKERFRTRDAAEWTVLFGASKIPAHGTLTTKEWMQSRHASSSGLVETVTLKGQEIKIPGPFSWCDRATVPSTKELREKTMRRDVKRSKDSADQKEWLSGIRIVDLCNVIAGPMISHTLCRFGCDVIKVDMGTPSYDASITTLLGLPANRGKRSVLLNLHTKEGRKLLNDLIRWADVVTVNQTMSQLTALGLDEHSLKRINPTIVLTHFNAFGGPRWGEWSDHLGYDDVLQAVLGIMSRFGGGLETPEEHAHIGTIDVVGGFCAALSCVAALFKRLRTGHADVARSSLASAGNLLQVSLAYDFKGRCWNEPSGHAKGRHALYRWYTSRDGEHFFLASGERCDQNDLLKSILRSFSHQECIDETKTRWRVEAKGGGGDIKHEDDETLSNLLQDCFQHHNLSTILRIVNKIPHVAAVKRCTLSNLRSRYSNSSSSPLPCTSYDFERIEKHPIGSAVTMFSTNASIRSKRGTIRRLRCAPKYGQDAESVLMDVLGLKSDEVKDMMKRGIVVSSWSKRYIPSGDPWSLSKEEYMSYITGKMKS